MDLTHHLKPKSYSHPLFNLLVTSLKLCAWSSLLAVTTLLVQASISKYIFGMCTITARTSAWWRTIPMLSSISTSLLMDTTSIQLQLINLSAFGTSQLWRGTYVSSQTTNHATLALTNFLTSYSVKKLREHTSVVNTCHASRRGPEMLVSGSDDGSVKVWDMRQKESALTLPSKVPITSVSFNDTADKVFIAGVDNEVKAFDLRKKVVDYALFSHTDSITGIALSTDGNFLLTNSLD